jgi:hypothetical protein
MKPRLLRLQKPTNESAWVMGAVLGDAGPGLSYSVDVEVKGTAKGYTNSAFGTESKRSIFLGVEEWIQGIMYRRGYGMM